MHARHWLPIIDVAQIDPRANNIFQPATKLLQRIRKFVDDIRSLCRRITDTNDLTPFVSRGRARERDLIAITYGTTIAGKRFPFGTAIPMVVLGWVSLGLLISDLLFLCYRGVRPIFWIRRESPSGGTYYCRGCVPHLGDYSGRLD